MCLAVPGRIIEILGEVQSLPKGEVQSLPKGEVQSLPKGEGGSAATMGPLATVDFQGSRVEVSLAMAPEASVGQWVLVHAGFAIAVLDEDEARQTWEYLQAGGAGEMPEQLRAGGGE